LNSRFNLVDLALFFRALPLARRAQLARRLPVAEVVKLVSRRGGRGRHYSVRRLEMAATRAISRWSRWFGGLDTCLTRSLVLGGLLVGRGDVKLNLGFRPGEVEPALDGHAWVTIDGRPVGADGSLAEERYTRVLAVPISKGSGEE
jgi:hypothetical protein